MNGLKAVLALSVALSAPVSYAGPETAPVAAASTSYITFTKTPEKVVRIDRTGELVTFSQCDRATDGQSDSLSNCTPLGRESGYTVEELNRRGKSYRLRNWLKNLITIPTGTACAALLTGGIAAVQLYDTILIGFLQSIFGMAEFSTVGMFHPRVLQDGMNNMGVGMVKALVGITMVFLAALAGGTVGIPVSWKLSRTWFPKYRHGFQALRFATAEQEQGEIPELTVKGSAEKFTTNLLKTLNGIPGGN